MLDSTVVFNEVMYHPAETDGLADAATSEWLELHNQMAVDMDLSGWSIDGIGFRFPENTVLAGGGYLVVAQDPAAISVDDGNSDDSVGIRVFGPFAGRLDNGGETLLLRNAGQRVMDSLTFSDRGPWSAVPDGTGHSLAKIDPQTSTAKAEHWTASTQRGGSPGVANFPAFDPTPAVQTAIPRDAQWQFAPSADVPQTNWQTVDFDAAQWQTGEAALFAGTFATIPPPDLGVPQSGSSLVVENPSFEANRHGDVGYGAIDGWASLGTVGINPTQTATAPFADNGSIADHRQVAFIQGRGSLSQVIQGLTVGQRYWLEVHYNARECCRAEPTIAIIFNGEVLLPPTDVEPVGDDNPYHVALLPFTAASESSPLVIRNVASSGDHTLLIDAVSIVPRDENQIPIQNSSFESIGAAAPGAMADNRLAGWQVTGNGTLGTAAVGDAVLGTATIPDGMVAAYLESTTTIHQTISGLQPDQRYELRIDVSAAANSPTPTLDIQLDGASAIQRELTNQQFETLSHRFVASASSIDFRIRQQTPGATALLDNVMIREINSPLVTELPVAAPSYFRHSFSFEGIPTQTDLELQWFVDDGAIAYLNGQEVARVNLPAGPLTPSTTAQENIVDPSWSESLRISSGDLQVGTNVLAIAVYPSGPDDTDLALAAELQTSERPLRPTETSLPITINELGPLANGDFLVELYNHGQLAIPAQQLELTIDGRAIAIGEVPLAAGVAHSIVVSEPLEEDDLIVLWNQVTGTALDARHVPTGGFARYPDGRGPFYRVQTLTPAAANTVPLESDVVINEILYHAPPTYADSGVAPTYQLETVLPLSANWRFNDSGTVLPQDWPQTRHATGGEWQQGPGMLGFERSQLIEPGIGTPLAEGRLVYYLETDFELSAETLASADAFQLRHVIDDGAVFYLNGQEFLRFNLPEGPLDTETIAASSINNAALSDAIEIPIDLLRVGGNRLSVQLHQRSVTSSDVVFGAELLLARIVDEGVPATPFAEQEQEWIELYNRGQSSVDLTGWQLDDAVRFEFPAGVRLDPQQYLVVARDAAALRTAYPEIFIAGQFDGQLSNSDERLILRDALGNAVDEVHYYDSGRWHEAADGGGSSLELRDPRADNAMAESWGPSSTDGRTSWKTYTYRSRATNPNNLNAPAVFDELILGLLDSGTVLLDDIRVIEDPDGTARDVIQNGDFESDSLAAAPAAWRWVGNHQDATVVSDPDDDGNQVLRLVATGPTEHMSNHGETTFADGVSIDPDQIYEISFRAKWISGSPLLNSRLYFGRAAKTTTLDIADTVGTPGAANSVAVANLGPSFSDFIHQPLVPAVDEPVTVRVRVDDPDGIESLVLHYSVDNNDFVDAAMVRDDDGSYVGTIPGQTRNDVVQFYVTAIDQRGASSQFPPAGPDSRAAYRVDTEIDAGRAHQLRIIMTRPDISALHTNSNVMSNDRLGATVIYNGREVFYDVGIRLRASGYGRQGALAGFNIQFDPQQLFRGVHGTIALDRGAVFSNGDGSGGVRGQSGASPHELLIYQIAHRAGGIGAMYDDVVYVDAPRSTNTGFALLKMARYSDVYLDSQFEQGGEGSLFKYELIYHATTTVDGDPESLKRAPNAVLGTDITDLGLDKEAYRYNFVLKNNRDRDDFEAIIRLGQTLSMSGPSLDTAAPAVMDVDQWMRTFALQSLVGTADTYNMGLAHNLELYVRPSDGRVLALPWDVDHGFYYSTRSNILGVGGSNLQRVIARPQHERLFHKHLLDIIQHAYNPETVRPWAEHYTEMTGLGTADFFVNYVTNRAGFVMDRLERSAPQIPFEITTNDGLPLVTDSATVVLNGQGWIDVDSIQQTGLAEPLAVTWLDQSQWQLELAVPAGEHTIELTAFDLRGNPVGSDSIVVRSTLPSSPVQQFLRVTELMYHPAPPTPGELAVNATWDDNSFEFVELANTSATEPLSLGGIRITNGFAEDYIQVPATLGPGQRGVLVADLAAFRARYGEGPIILGEFTGQLSNGGERIRLEDAAGRLVLDFSYDDQAPWPTAADGQGPSLELINERTAVDLLGTADRWQASAALGGSPGSSPGLAGDFTQDGQVNADDIDALCRAEPEQLEFDLNGDGRIDPADLQRLVEDILQTSFGDANLDGVFDSRDLVQIFQAGQYDDGRVGNSGWSTGDWNCDGEFDSSDLVVAFQRGRYR